MNELIRIACEWAAIVSAATMLARRTSRELAALRGEIQAHAHDLATGTRDAVRGDVTQLYGSVRELRDALAPAIAALPKSRSKRTGASS